MEEKRSSHRALKIFLSILLPVIFLLLLITLLLKFSGVDPVDAAKQLVGGSSPAAGNENGTSVDGTSALKQKIAEQEATIKQLRGDSQKKSDQITQLNDQLKQAQENAGQTAGAAQKQAAADRQAVYAQTYKNMDPVKAAAIFNKIPVKNAAQYLNMLDNKTKAAILENLPAGKAAQLTPMLKANANTSSSAGPASASQASPSAITTPPANDSSEQGGETVPSTP
ncbi:hypothetical protein EWH99_00485 [Sporolactobacillus sp. THM7-7]|nr:hypothetical protein EWH99_00485 [Sporolactobacillus sp. THM7-7]